MSFAALFCSHQKEYSVSLQLLYSIFSTHEFAAQRCFTRCRVQSKSARLQDARSIHVIYRTWQVNRPQCLFVLHSLCLLLCLLLCIIPCTIRCFIHYKPKSASTISQYDNDSSVKARNAHNSSAPGGPRSKMDKQNGQEITSRRDEASKGRIVPALRHVALLPSLAVEDVAAVLRYVGGGVYCPAKVSLLPQWHLQTAVGNLRCRETAKSLPRFETLCSPSSSAM
jgi:hypothetical protein